MSRYGLEMAERHLSLLYKQLEQAEYWRDRYSAEYKQAYEEGKQIEQRILDLRKFITDEKERLNESSK